MRNRLFMGWLLAGWLSLPAGAAGLKIENGWVRATAPGQKVAAAYMALTADTDMALVGGATPAARVVELHYMAMQDGEMIMRQLESIELPSDKTVNLGPGGLHVMLIGLKKQLMDGESLGLRLDFRDAAGKRQSLDLKLPVRRTPPEPPR